MKVNVYDLLNNKTVTADIGSETDIYIPRIKFSNNPNTLCIQRLNRLQNKLEFLFTDVKTGNSKVVYTDESKTYVDITDDREVYVTFIVYQILLQYRLVCQVVVLFA